MEYTNIFEMSQKNALYLNKLTDVHKDKVRAIETKMNNFRDKVKTELVSACNKSYLSFKKLKNISILKRLIGMMFIIRKLLHLKLEIIQNI